MFVRISDEGKIMKVHATALQAFQELLDEQDEGRKAEAAAPVELRWGVDWSFKEEKDYVHALVTDQAERQGWSVQEWREKLLDSNYFTTDEVNGDVSYPPPCDPTVDPMDYID